MRYQELDTSTEEIFESREVRKFKSPEVGSPKVKKLGSPEVKKSGNPEVRSEGWYRKFYRDFKSVVYI
jgi:hypothetical protein